MHDVRDMERLAGRKDAIEEIYAERQRQIVTEGWTPEHDDQHATGELAMAAGSYAIRAGAKVRAVTVPLTWPWSDSWWKPTDRRRDLIKAGALIVAEIERLDRAEAR